MNYIKLILIVLVVSMIGLVGCSSKNIEMSPNKSNFSIDFKWSKRNMCNSTISPKIILNNLPSETVRLQWSLKDLQVPQYNHGSGSIKAMAIIQEGTLKGYRGPCPPSTSALGHFYRFTIKAINVNGKTIGIAKKKIRCKRYIDMK